MLLYLTSNKNRSLIDGAAKETNLAVKKLVGKYVLRNFIVKEIRNFAAIKCLVVDVSCAEDSLEDFSILYVADFSIKTMKNQVFFAHQEGKT